MSVKTFWSAAAPFARESLRRYGGTCKGKYGYHNAEVVLGDVDLPVDSHGHGADDHDHADLRWPKKCEHCDYIFADSDEWQHKVTRIYEGGGHRFVLNDAPIGAMWDATWFPAEFGKGADGIALIVKTPGGSWHVDGRSSDCTKPDDKTHRCWVRHGDPRTGSVHVDKNGDTCQAGAGSIQIGSYHGFLTNGVLM